MNSYFDHNATTPLGATAREAWLEASERFWHNPSSLYREAGAAKRLLEDAREELADRLGCEPERVVFTSGATEGNQSVMRQAASRQPGGRVLISPVEHPSVREAAGREFGPDRVVEMPQSSHEAADLMWLSEAVGSGEAIALVSLMAANNETGVIQPWRKAAEICRGAGVWFHSDASQWIGKRPAAELGGFCDLVTGCAHKFGGPKGTGFLIIPEEGLDNFRSFVGGPQESGHRAGTEDLPGILSMLAALRDKTDGILEHQEERWLADRRHFEATLTHRLPGTRLVAESADRLWNTVMLILPGTESNLKWLTRLSGRGFAVSTGSACSAGKGAPSRVMAAMGLEPAEMGRVIRVSGGWETARSDWEALVGVFVEVAADLEAGTPRGGRLPG